MPTERGSRLRLPALLAAPLLMAGCTDGMNQGVASTGPAFGESVKQTLAAQVIDPAPTYDTPNPTTSGQQAAAAQDRYATDQVKKPERISTSRSSTGGNGGI